MISKEFKKLSFSVKGDRLAVCRFSPDTPVPSWAFFGQGFVSITRTTEELSIIAAEPYVPVDTKAEVGWRLIKAEGPFDFSLTGIVASIGDPLRDAGVSILWVSTFDTDYLIVKDENLEKCVKALRDFGHSVA